MEIVDKFFELLDVARQFSVNRLCHEVNLSCDKIRSLDSFCSNRWRCHKHVYQWMLFNIFPPTDVFIEVGYTVLGRVSI